MRYLLLFLLAPICLAQTVPSNRKLIEFGWDEPSASFMRQHAAEMEATPFDGCVFHLTYQADSKKTANFAWYCWGKHAFQQSDLQGAIDDLMATKFQHFTENFLRFDAVPADIDWFEDYTPVLQNIELAAHITKITGCRGVLLDTEQYATKLWNYRKQRDAKTKSWDEYALQVRKRGAEFMNALQRRNPDAVVFMTFAYALPYDEAEGDAKKLPTVGYGLLVPFLNGMLDAAGPGIKFVDGYEESYDYKTAAEFAAARKKFAQGVLKGFVVDRQKYQQHFQLGYGIWMDFDSEKKGWSVSDPGKNYFTPESFEKSVRQGLAASDRYVWIYTQIPWWWSDEGKPQNLPPAYEAALRRARQP